MPTPSAGLLVYRDVAADGGPVAASGSRHGPGLEVLLVHPGGPLWRHRDDGTWTIPKGEIEADDDPWSTARREFAEELGMPPPPGRGIDLGEVTQRSGKRVRAWALAGDLDVTEVRSNTFEMEWPPRSGRTRSFPEIDRAEWFALPTARVKLIEAQVAFLDRLVSALDDPGRGANLSGS